MMETLFQLMHEHIFDLTLVAIQKLGHAHDEMLFIKA